MSEAQQREVRESQARMAEVETRLAQMPPGQRDMVLQRMGPQMEMMKRMASGGDLELVTEVHAIHVNPDQATMREVQMAAAAASLGGATGGVMGMSMNAVPPAAAQASAPTGPATPAAAADGRGAQQACLEERARKQQQAQKKKRGLGSLVSAVARNAGRLGGEAITSVIGEAQNARATADDLSAAAKDLGLSEDDVAACRDAG